MKFAGVALAAVAACTVAGAANAATYVYTSDTIGPRNTNYTETLHLQQFDASWGTLTSIKITLFGTVAGTASAENTGGEAADIGLFLSGTLTLKRPDGSTIVVANPVVNEVASLGAFDSIIDYAGTSGTVISGLSDDASNSVVLTSPADFGLFTGTGFLDSLLSARAFSGTDGTGNVSTAFSTQASGHAVVEYTFDAAPSVPEPATWALMVLGIGMVGASIRRRGIQSVAA